MKRLAAFLLAVCFILAAAPAVAIEATEQLADKKLEARAVRIGESLRCVVCASGTVNDSPAGVAGDLRRLIRRLILEGKDNAAVIDYIHTRYGDYVLLQPPFNPGTFFLWLAPFLLLAAGLWVYAGFVFPKNKVAQKLK